MNSISELKKIQADLKKSRQSVRNELRSYSAAKLMITKDGKDISFRQIWYEDGKRKQKGIGRKASQIYRLAHKAYLEELLKSIELNLQIVDDLVNKCIDTDPDMILKKLPKNYDLLKSEFIINPRLMESNDMRPHPVSDGSVAPINLALNLSQMMAGAYPNSDCNFSPADWFVMPYCENTYKLDHKKHTAYNGLKTRSKSESILLASYGARNILYHYDEIFYVNGYKISPDVISVRDDGSLVVHEHAGVWEDNYIEKAQSKIRLYNSIGFYQGKNLLLTFDDENGNINQKLIDVLIDDMFNQ